MVDASSRPLLVFADDWGRHPSSCQHLIGQLLDRHQVYWINTIGMRTPRLDRMTLIRGLEKVRSWIWPSQHIDPQPPGSSPRAKNPVVISPKMWPWFSTPLDRTLNRRLLGRALQKLCSGLPIPPVAVTTLPIVADLMETLPVERWVYYCVDDFGQWPGLDQLALRRMEMKVIDQAHVLIAVSEHLRSALSRSGKPVHLLTHGIDLEHWTRPTGAATRELLAGFERPLVVFWGLVDRRLDMEMVRSLAMDLTEGTILFVGPEQDPDPALFRLPRVARLGTLAYGELPGLAREASVLIMPYADLPVTRAIQPLKLKEYLATGKPTVVRRLPAVEELLDCLDPAATPEEFSAKVRMRLAVGLPSDQRQARLRLHQETWAEKARLLRSWAFAEEPAAHALSP